MEAEHAKAKELVEAEHAKAKELVEAELLKEIKCKEISEKNENDKITNEKNEGEQLPVKRDLDIEER